MEFMCSSAERHGSVQVDNSALKKKEEQYQQLGVSGDRSDGASALNGKHV